MGADLIGASITLPVKLSDKEKQKLRDHFKELKKILDTPNISKIIAKELNSNYPYLNKILELAPGVVYAIDECSDNTDPEEIEEVLENVIDTLGDIDTMLDMDRIIDHGSLYARDTSSCSVKIHNRDYETFFGGEMSWGDEPEGAGYEFIKNLIIAGLQFALEEHCFHNQPNTQTYLEHLGEET